MADPHIHLSEDWRLALRPILLDFIPKSIVWQFPLLNPGYPELHRYLRNRGISPLTYERFGVRVNPGLSELAFIFTNIHGNPIGMVFRNIYDKKISGLKIEGVELPKKAKRGAWFGMHLIDVSKPLLVCEGEMDAMLAYEFGYTNVASPGGMSLTKQQARAIYNKEILVGFDSDKAGNYGWEQVKKLWPDKRLTKINWSPFKDVGEIKNSRDFWRIINGS